MSSPDNLDLVGVGELLWDCFPDGRRPGGAPANFVFHANQLGLSASVCSRVGDDAAGRALCEFLVRRGLSTGLVQVDRERPTGTVTVDTTDPTHPRFVIHENVAWDAIEFTDELRGAVARASAVYVGTLAQRCPVSRRTIADCLEAAGDALVVYDVNLRPPHFERGWIAATLERTDVVKLNLDEVEELAGLLDLGPADPGGFARGLLQRHERLRWVCITRGGDGCLVVGPEESCDLPGQPVEVADAVGAGDAFTAALVAARLRDWSVPVAARFANTVGAMVAARSGAMPELDDELRRLTERMTKEAGG